MVIGSKLYRVKECADSLAWAKEHIADAPDGSVFLADILCQAHGRQGRTWQIKPGQLLITLLLKPSLLQTCSFDDIPIRLNQLNMALSVGIAKALEPYGVGIKWPNDFVVNDKKVGGILAHVVWHNNLPAGIVFGLGLNVNTLFEPDEELYDIATSLTMFTGQLLDMRATYRIILEHLDAAYALWRERKFDEIYRQWKVRQVYLGKKLTIHQKNGSLVSGIMSQVLPNGDMMLMVEGKGIQVIPFCIVQDVKVS